jgi:hypothetical protein
MKNAQFSLMRVSGSVSHWIQYTGMSIYLIRFYNTNTGDTFDYFQHNYTNVGGNHVSYPCMIQTTAYHPAGLYYVYIYQWVNIMTDFNDSIYLTVEVIPG